MFIIEYFVNYSIQVYCFKNYSLEIFCLGTITSKLRKSTLTQLMLKIIFDLFFYIWPSPKPLTTNPHLKPHPFTTFFLPSLPPPLPLIFYLIFPKADSTFHSTLEKQNTSDNSSLISNHSSFSTDFCFPFFLFALFRTFCNYYIYCPTTILSM